MAVNKVVRRDGTVEIDISDTTAEAEEVADGKVFYNKAGARSIGTLETAYIAIYGVTTYADLRAALTAGKTVIVKEIPHNGESITMLTNWHSVSGTQIDMEGITTALNDIWDIDVTVTSSSIWSSSFVSQDPFMLLDFAQTISVTIPVCTKNIANTQIPNVDISITDEMGVNWAIASLAKFEVKNDSGQRINAWPVCQFSMNGQKTLRLRMMCGGNADTAAANISGAILLKHR